MSDYRKFIVDPKDLETKVVELFKHGWKRGVSTGWSSLDRFYTVEPGELTIITGIPGHGKSSFLDALLVNLAEREPWCFGIFSPENTPFAGHGRSLIRKHVGKMELTNIEALEGSKWLSGIFNFVNFPMEMTPTLDETLEILRHAASTNRSSGVKHGFVIDPWNELEHWRPPQLTETEYVSQALTKIRKWAQVGPYAVWLVAHPRIMRRESSGKMPCITGYDISGSANFFNKADNLLSIKRDVMDPHGKVEISVLKVRRNNIGKPGTCELAYDVDCGRYSDG